MTVSKSSYITLIVLALIWGSSFILMKEGLKAIEPLQLAALRIAIAGVVLLPFVRWRNVKIERKDWSVLALSGLLGSFFPAFLFAFAQTQISSSLSGALNSLTPLFVLTIGLVVFGVPFNKYKTWGVIVGFIGALMLLLSNGIDLTNSNNAYSLFVVLAAICYGTNVNILKYRLSHYRPLVVSAIPLAMVSVPSFIYLAVTGLGNIQISPEVNRSLGAIVLLAVVGTALSVIWFNQLIQRTNAIFASSVTYLIPIVALVWGFIDGESIGWMQIGGLITVLIAIKIVNKA